MTTAYLLAILTGLTYGLQGTYGKYLTHRFPSVILAWATFFFSIPLVGLYLLWQGIPAIDGTPFVLATLVSLSINLVAWNLFFKALSYSPLYLTMPFTTFTPLFMVPVAYFLLGELPGWRGQLGILLIILGAYGLHLQSANLWAPVRSLFREKGSRLMLLIALLWSISATVEKIAVGASSPAFYAFTINAVLAVGYWPFLMRSGFPIRQKIASHGQQLFLLGTLAGLVAVFQYTALDSLLASYVIAFKRAGVLFSVFLGWLLFGEPKPVKHLLFSGLMISGATLILIDGIG